MFLSIRVEPMGLPEQPRMTCRKQKPAVVSDGWLVKKPPVYTQHLSHSCVRLLTEQPVVISRKNPGFENAHFFCLLMSQIKSSNSGFSNELDRVAFECQHFIFWLKVCELVILGWRLLNQLSLQSQSPIPLLMFVVSFC